MPTIVIDPGVEAALTFADVAQQCRLDDESERQYVEQILIPSVCSMFEQYTRCKLISSVLEDVLPAWPSSGRLDLGYGPVSDVAIVTYLDTAGLAQDLAPNAYYKHLDGPRGSLHLAGSSPPLTLCHPGALRVRYTAGFSEAAAAIPPGVRHWLLAHIATFMLYRESGGDVDFKVIPLMDGLIADFLRHSI